MAERSIHCVVIGGVRQTEQGGERLTYGIDFFRERRGRGSQPRAEQ